MLKFLTRRRTLRDARAAELAELEVEYALFAREQRILQERARLHRECLARPSERTTTRALTRRNNPRPTRRQTGTARPSRSTQTAPRVPKAA